MVFTAVLKKLCCVSCMHDLNDPCPNCQIRRLKDYIRQYEEVIRYLMNLSSPQLHLKNYQIVDLMQFYRSKSPMPFETPISEELHYWKFLTITFDPEKFGISNEPGDEKNYILHHLLRVYKLNYCSALYGCFEQHQSGRVHSHIVIKVLDNDIYGELKRSFTDNPRNKHAVDIGLARFPQAIKYIEKESTDYFQLGIRNPLDEIIESSIADNPSPLNCA